MRLQKTTLIVTFLTTICGWAQDSTQTNTSLIESPKLSYLDSIRATFVQHDVATCVDERWLKTVNSSDLFNELVQDFESIDVDQAVDYELSTELLKKRLKILDSKSAFNIEYNKGLENIIKHYLKNRKRSFERLMGLSQYYFPIFEEKLAKYNVPLEIKYLAIVESALNPKAVSKMGATGLWQFMYGTGKQYNLEINTFVDERSDLLKSTEAACQYMVNMYKIYGDWDLVLASYNAGPGNVSKAIRRSGGKQNYWNIRPYLPKETQGYVPAFLATMYVYEFHKEHGIQPAEAVLNFIETDTVLVKSKMNFKQISDLVGITKEELQFLNPSYKRDFIPEIPGKKHYLRMPLDKIAIFTSNEDKMYAYAAYDFSKRERPNTSSDLLATNESTTTSQTTYHTVRRGESLGLIAKKYRVSISDLKRWNGLKSNTIQQGKRLKIVETKRIKSPSVAATNKNDVKDSLPSTNLLVSSDKSPVKEGSNLENEKIYIVAKGDVLGAIAQKHGVDISDLRKWNQLSNKSVIHPGMKLHIVQPDDFVSTIADRSSDNESSSWIHHKVKKGETLSSIATKNNVSISDLQAWNQLKNSNLQINQSLKIKTASANKTNAVTYYTVEKGDSLYSIAKKIPGVTVEDLKKWNDISDNKLQPGMRLRVNG